MSIIQPSTFRRSLFIQRLSTACTFPLASSLSDPTCHICQEPSLCENGSETPIKLDCGHVFGMTCLLTHAEVSHPATCPLCREPILDNLRLMDEVTALHSRRRFQQLARWTPGNAIGDRDLIGWIRAAERMWRAFCEGMLWYVERHSLVYLQQLDGAVAEFLDRRAPSPERVLSFGTVYHFYQAYFRQGWRPEQDELDEFGTLFTVLMEHLGRREFDDAGLERWRIFQAFQSPVSQLGDWRIRMEQSRVGLSRFVDLLDSRPTSPTESIL
ncbi:MAG: hypothetical protein Q9170_005313 [Blastenia crenularia]